METRYPQDKLTIVGGGIVGALEAYLAYLDAKKQVGNYVLLSTKKINPFLERRPLILFLA